MPSDGLTLKQIAGALKRPAVDDSDESLFTESCNVGTEHVCLKFPIGHGINRPRAGDHLWSVPQSTGLRTTNPGEVDRSCLLLCIRGSKQRTPFALFTTSSLEEISREKSATGQLGYWHIGLICGTKCGLISIIWTLRSGKRTLG